MLFLNIHPDITEMRYDKKIISLGGAHNAPHFQLLDNIPEHIPEDTVKYVLTVLHDSVVFFL